ncbi:hypothetical protein F2Q69_00010296 [Brassica cretica]|uniref:Uncharacterized protein n=1 Tax=Brassica cretica TaxID=69181 RepID=A0A8S9R6D2_BRACR|nr:hypothetical protein F2Q69_00010296 [Brassica cretica]
MATKAAIFELIIPDLYQADRNRDVLKLGVMVLMDETYIRREREREKQNFACLVSNLLPYPIILRGGDVIISPEEEPPKNQYFDESHLYSTVRFLIHNLSDLDTAMEYARFTAFTTTRTATTTATCDLIIAALCEAKRYTDAYHLFHYFFNQSNISLSVDCCNHIVKALCDDGHANLALQFHHHIRGDDAHALDYQTYRILTKALYLSGYMDEALDLVKDIFSLNDAYKYDSILLDQKDFDKAWALCCEELISGNNNNNNGGYATVTKTAVKVSLIEYHFSKGEEDKAMEIYTCLVAETSGKIEDASKRPLLDVLFKYGKETEAWSLVKNHPERKRNVFYCSHMMASKTIERFEKVRQMQDLIMCKFNHAPYSNVLTRCCEEENTLSQAKLIMAELLNKHDPSAYKISTFEELINAYLKAGRLDDLNEGLMINLPTPIEAKMMMMMLLRRRTLLKSSSFLNRHISSTSATTTWNNYEDEKDLYTTVRSLIRSSELNKAVEYARSPVAEKSRMATRVAICELVAPALDDAKRYKDVLSLILDSRLYNNSLYCRYLIRKAKRHELNKCLVSNPPPYPIILGGDVIISPEEEPPKNQYYCEKHLYWKVRFLIQNLSDLDTAVEYARFTAFATSRTETTTATCDLIIAALCEAKRYMDAYHLFHYFFNQSNISLSVDCCNHIVKALCDDGHAHVALQLHHHIRGGYDDHALLDYQTYRILTKALYLSGKYDEALDLVKDIFLLKNPDEYDSEFLDQKDFDKGWALCCEEFISSKDGNNNNVGKEDKAMEIYTCLVAETSGKIEDASKRPLLDVLFKYGKETEAWSLVENHHLIEDRPLHIMKQNLTMHELFCCHLRMTKESIERFEKPRQMQDFVTFKFNHAPYSNVIAKCCEDENTLPRAKWILAESLNVCDPSAYKLSTFEEMINAYLKAGRLDDALETANMMVDANLRLVSILMKS